MKLVQFKHDGRASIGVLTDDGIVDISHHTINRPASLREILNAGAPLLEQIRRECRNAGRRIAMQDAQLCAPITDPQKFLGLGFSYKSHVAEIRERRKDIQIPANQVWFNKQVSCIAGPYDDIHKPAISELLDYEGEMGVVIGTRCRHVRAVDARHVIAGYMVCNDVSVRDWQLRAPTATLGKSFDTHGPTGPWLTLTDELADAQSLRLQTWVNGEIRQDNRTSDFIYTLGQMIEELTTVCTLEPGDILATGTPGGVGAASNPPRYLKIGDVVRIEIEDLGAIENRVIAEPGQ